MNASAIDDRDARQMPSRIGLNAIADFVALSAAWPGEPADLVRALCESLLAALSVDFVFVELMDNDSGERMHFSRVRSALPDAAATPSAELLRRLLGEDPRCWPASSRQRVMDDEFSLEVVGIRRNGLDDGVIVVGARRNSFPDDAEKLLLTIASNQALLAWLQAKPRAASKSGAGALIAGFPGFMAVLGPDGRIQRVNREIEEYCGHTIDELQNWATNGTVHPDDLPHLADIFSRSIATGTPYDIEQRLRRFDGEYRWFENRGRPVRDEHGRIVAWHVLLTDIDDRKRAEGALAASERNLQLTIDSIPALVWSARTDGTGDFFNKHYLDYVGLSLEDMQGWQWTRVLHPDDLRPIAAAWESFGAEGTACDVEARIRRHDGIYRWFHFRAYPLRAENGQIARWYGVNVDIEEQKRAAIMLAGEKQLLEMIASGRSLREVLLTLCNVVASASPGCDCQVRTSDRSGEELDYGAAPSALTAAQRRPILSKGGDVLGTLCLSRREFSSPQPDQQDLVGRAVHIASIAIERLRTEDALDKLRSDLAHLTRVMSLGELAASIAHEVNQPLSGILTNASTCLLMLAADAPDIQGAIRTAKRTVRDANRAGEVIRRLRGLFRKQEFVREPLDLNEAAQEVIAICSHDLKRRRVALTVNLDPTLPSVIGDRIQLQQVILNLVLNAADAIGAVDHQPRQIWIETAQCAPGMAELRVRDTGVGVTDEDVGKLFEAFYTTKPSGMGVGLSVSKSILERHDGKIWVTFNDGPGSTFGFSIPIAADGPRA